MALEVLPPRLRRIHNLLADGLPHSRKEIHSLLSDEMQPLSRVSAPISVLRTYLRPKGLDILCTIHNRTVHYQLVRLLASNDE